MCYDSIQQAALQVYYSLPCVPIRAQIRTTYAHELKNKYVITQGLDDHWQRCLRAVSTGANIKSLAISASGRLIASAGDTPGVQLWDTLTGSNTGHFRGSGTSSCPVIFSPSGDYVAIGYDTGTVDIWDVTTGQRLLDPSQSSHDTSVTVLAFSQNSFFIAAGAADATVRVWDMSTKSLKHSLAYHEGPILCLSFSFSDGLFATGSDDTSIITSDVHSGRLARTFKGHTSRVNSISFSPDSGSIASGSDDQSVRLWDTRTGVCLRTFAGTHKKPIRQVWITADNKFIVSVCNLDIYMWETSPMNRRSPQHIWSVNRSYKKATTMFPAWYAKLVKFVPTGLFGRLFETDDGTVLYTAPSHDGMAMGCVYSSFVFFLQCSAPQRSWSRVRRPLAKPSTLDEPPLSTGTDDLFTAVAMTLDATLLITSVHNGTIKIWDTSPRSNWKTFQSYFKRTVEGFWPALDERSLLVKPVVGLQLVTPAGTLIKDPETGGDGLSEVGVVPSPDSRYFAYWAEYAWNLDGSFSIHIYDASTGVRLNRIPGFFNITCGRFSMDSSLFACAHGDGIVQIWELPSMLCKTTIMTEHTAITALEFLPGSDALVVGSDKGCVEIRLVENGDVIHRIECSPSKVLALAVPNEALIVIVGHEDGSIFVCDPSYTNVAPHCLLQKTPDDAVRDPDGIDFIKFTEGYRSICTRSQNGVICTWDLTRCLAEYAKQAKETSVESAVADIVATDVSTQSPELPGADPSDRSTSSATLDSFGARDDTVAPADSTPVEPPSLLPQNEAPEPESIVAPQITLEALTISDTPTTTSPLTSVPQCPHLVSRSDANIVYDRYFRSTYSVDGREGWVYRGSRRMFWLPNDLRPASSTALSAFEDRLVILTRSNLIMFFDLSEDSLLFFGHVH